MTLSQASAAETIVAVGSPPGRSPRGLLRLSGPRTDGVLAAVLADRSAALPLPRRLAPVRLVLPPTAAPLPALVLRFTGPASYTGQDMAELQVPGNPALLDRLIRALLDAGARPAEPGEFTFRALLAGKLGLTEAEGVAATIAATSDSELRAASMLRRGELGRRAEQLVEALGRALALTEAGIDFVDQEGVVPITPGELAEAVASVQRGVDELLAHARPWGAVSDLPWVVLVGPPSVGKSTLFNALLGRPRAVVDPAPGTTRDVLAEPLRLRDAAGPDAEVMLVDLAGLDHPAGWLDKRVQSAARAAIDRADVVLRVRDAAAASPPVFDPPPSAAVIDVWARLDAPGAAPPPAGTLGVSALRGKGLGALRVAIRRAVGDRVSGVAAGALALQPRHEAALRAASQELARAADLLAGQRNAPALGGIELVAGCLRAALDELAALGGRLTPDDVIGRVFATFCVGK